MFDLRNRLAAYSTKYIQHAYIPHKPVLEYCCAAFLSPFISSLLASSSLYHTAGPLSSEY